MSTQKVKGSVLRSRLSFVEGTFGEEDLRRVLESLSAEDQEALDRMLPSTWLPFEVGRRLDDSIVKVLGGGRPEFFERLGIASAEKNLTTVHSMFLTPGDPHAFLAKAPHIYRLYYQTGRRDYEQTGEKAGVLTTTDAETFSNADCMTVIGWYKRALEYCGATNPQVVEEECRAKGGEACRYRVSWE
jgi:uncharacterized protein (TIGR02265 family)